MNLPPDYRRIRRVNSFQELLHTPFTDGVNALVWERTLAGDFTAVVAQLEAGEGITRLDESRLRTLPVSAAGRTAIDVMLEDQQRLRAHGLAPELNCIRSYP